MEIEGNDDRVSASAQLDAVVTSGASEQMSVVTEFLKTGLLRWRVDVDLRRLRAIFYLQKFAGCPGHSRPIQLGLPAI
jgi:hypothetical protein